MRFFLGIANRLWRLAVTVVGALALLTGGCRAAVVPSTPLAMERPTGLTSAPTPVPTPLTVISAASPAATATPAPNEVAIVGPAIGRPAPDFTLLDLDGNRVRLRDFKGKPVLLNFFASWCGPCVQEVPTLAAAQQRFKAQGLQLILVNLQEEPAVLRGFVRRLGLEHLPVLLDRQGTVAAQLYQVPGLPATFFIDAAGILQGRHIGALDQASLQTSLARLGSSGDREPVEQGEPSSGRSFCPLDGC